MCKIHNWGLLYWHISGGVCHILSYGKFKNSAKLRINNSTVNVFYGDIFKQEELKVIAFNEYFDTIVDDKIISHTSLNGQYLDKHITDIDQLNSDIEADERLKEHIADTNEKRKIGKK